MLLTELFLHSACFIKFHVCRESKTRIKGNAFYKAQKKYSEAAGSSAIVTHSHNFKRLPCTPTQVVASVQEFVVTNTARN